MIDPLNTNNAICHDSLTLNRAQKRNIKFIKKKVQPKVPQGKYLGHTTDETRTRPGTDKIEAIRQMPISTNKQELQSLLGFLSYFAKFIKLSVKYIPGKDLIITDALSRGPHNFKHETNSTEDIEIIESLPILPERLDKL